MLNVYFCVKIIKLKGKNTKIKDDKWKASKKTTQIADITFSQDFKQTQNRKQENRHVMKFKNKNQNI